LGFHNKLGLPVEQVVESWINQEIQEKSSPSWINQEIQEKSSPSSNQVPGGI